ncbi:MAG TPA: hypothetical protein QGF58_11200 [Myxococcota bacterium]|nr:hypothetical protein [Myxococcota bacterium]
MIPILTIALSNPSGDELPFRELAEHVSPAAYTCLVEANADGPVLVDVSSRGGNLSVKPASAHEGDLEICVVAAVLDAKRPELPDGSAQLSFGLERGEPEPEVDPIE